MLYSNRIYTLETEHHLSERLSNEWKLHTHTHKHTHAHAHAHTNAYAHALTQTNTHMLSPLGVDTEVSLQSKEIKAVTALLSI